MLKINYYRLVMAVVLFIQITALSFAAVISQPEEELNIPVLCYHRFGPIAKSNYYALSTRAFEEHLTIIKEEGFTPITAKEAISALKGEGTWPAKPILITVDDGYKDFITYAKPVLDKAGYKATLFVYSDFVGSRSGFSKKQLEELSADGYEIGSHSYTHSKLSKRPKNETLEQRNKRLNKELKASREKLTIWSGSEVKALAYPYGLWDTEVGQKAKESGFELMFTVCSGMNRPLTDKVRWHRYMMVNGLKPETFRAYLKERVLVLTETTPGPGERLKGPLKEISATLSEEMMQKINLKTLVAKSGHSVYPLKVDYKTGKLIVTITSPWTKGINQISLTASDHKGRFYRENWLITIDKSF